MNHTLYGSIVRDIWMNGALVGETAINAGIAGYFDVPVGVVSGDDKLTKEATSLLGNIETAVVKEGIDRYVARCPPLMESRARIKNAVKRAIERRKEFKPLKYTSPVTFKVCFASTTEASMCCLSPMVKRVDGRTVSFNLNDYLDAYRMLNGLLSFASTGGDNGFG